MIDILYGTLSTLGIVIVIFSLVCGGRPLYDDGFFPLPPSPQIYVLLHCLFLSSAVTKKVPAGYYVYEKRSVVLL
jgi:hypothetical protein